jgi:hypothetical protein
MDKKEQLVEAVLESAEDGQSSDGRKTLACGDAFELARELGTEITEIGRICNQHNIKIRKCQLGCFR